MTFSADPSDVPVGRVETLPALLQWRARLTPTKVARWSLDAQGTWRSESWAEVVRSVVSVVGGLTACGLRKGAHVGVMASTSAGWDDCSMAVMAMRGVVVGIDVHGTSDAVRSLLQLVPISAIVIDQVEQLKLLGDVRPPICIVLSAGKQPLPTGCVSIADWKQQSSESNFADWNLADWNLAVADDVALVVFTSGTTGDAKGIAYKHVQVCAAVDAILEAYPDIDERCRLACWLPLSNLFQRIVNFCAIKKGAESFYVSEPRDVMRHLPMIRPTVFIGVPRFFEKLLEGVVAKLQDGGGVRAALASRLFAFAVNASATRRAGRPVGAMLAFAHALSDRLLMRRIRGTLGGELQYLISGSAPMPPALLTQFDAIGLPILEAYGLSECVVPVALNRPHAQRQGTVGLPLRTVSLRVDTDGELLVRSIGVFAGYIGGGGVSGVDAEGFLRTGDLAEIDADGYLRLVGRKSEVFKLSTGRRVAPAFVEGLFAGLPGVEHLLVFGAGRKALLLVVSLKAGALLQLVQGQLQQRIGSSLDHLPHALQPVGAVFTWRPFGVATGELTANLKVRRAKVELRYRQALDQLEQALKSTEVAGGHLRLENHGEPLVLVGLQSPSRLS